MPFPQRVYSNSVRSMHSLTFYVRFDSRRKYVNEIQQLSLLAFHTQDHAGRVVGIVHGQISLAILRSQMDQSNLVPVITPACMRGLRSDSMLLELG